MVKPKPDQITISRTTKTFFCSCSNKFQDNKYGPGKRVHNQTKQNTSPNQRGWRCTGCAHEKV